MAVSASPNRDVYEARDVFFAGRGRIENRWQTAHQRSRAEETRKWQHGKKSQEASSSKQANLQSNGPTSATDSFIRLARNLRRKCDFPKIPVSRIGKNAP
jgi:hypothetical protein